MVKAIGLMKIEREAEAALVALINSAPNARAGGVVRHIQRDGRQIAFVLEAWVNERPTRLICEIKADGRGMAAQKAIGHLKSWLSPDPRGEAPVFIAPFIGPDVRELCRASGVGYLDLTGNCRLFLNGLFIERASGIKPPAARRELRSLFKPKSARVLRLLLQEPDTPRRLSEVSQKTKVSIGQVHKVKEALRANDWLSETSDGIFLIRPAAVLDSWRDEYAPPNGERSELYTPLFGESLLQALRALPMDAPGDRAALAGFSAADWIAPYVRANTLQIYASPYSADRVRELLKATPTPRGANLVLIELDDEGPLLDAREAVPGIVTTSPIQTYLDLWTSGDRGLEAAEHLRREAIGW